MLGIGAASSNLCCTIVMVRPNSSWVGLCCLFDAVCALSSDAAHHCQCVAGFCVCHACGLSFRTMFVFNCFFCKCHFMEEAEANGLFDKDSGQVAPGTCQCDGHWLFSCACKWSTFRQGKREASVESPSVCLQQLHVFE